MEPLKVGDYVTTNYSSYKSRVVRQITEIVPGMCGSGFMAKADGGKFCEHCKCTPDRPTKSLDSAWFKKVTEDSHG